MDNFIENIDYVFDSIENHNYHVSAGQKLIQSLDFTSPEFEFAVKKLEGAVIARRSFLDTQKSRSPLPKTNEEPNS